MRRCLAYSAMLPLLWLSLCSTALRAQEVSWLPDSLSNGSPCLFSVHLQGANHVTGTWQGHPLTFFRTHDPATWDVLAGIDVAVKPGVYPLQIEATLADGTTRHTEQSIRIEEAPYPTTTLTVPEKFVAPSAASLKIIAADRVLKEQAFAKTSPQPLWSGPFRPPLAIAPKTDSFGTRRTFNGTLASIHRGMDYRAKPLTPVKAVNAGRVILAHKLYYEGNCVIIDHGQGLMTLYMHLSHFRVRQGDNVRQGQLLGLSGATGRVTGPHLHLGVRWQGAYLDASKLFQMELPATPTVQKAVPTP
ncbi:MAG: M23 family metallopeptidase [Edaphobacter sp.]|uniref:M23 family metallopeptidase n=1 Tax=Edaphobacter sp. TaxID=1934404 RepID=UPI0023972A11|nr:M23 family metallopeptidase [Edaphobacter sp.]MDE1175164.1 M23 family metallopeptidase [Edaphobacter sp.]